MPFLVRAEGRKETVLLETVLPLVSQAPRLWGYSQSGCLLAPSWPCLPLLSFCVSSFPWALLLSSQCWLFRLCRWSWPAQGGKHPWLFVAGPYCEETACALRLSTRWFQGRPDPCKGMGKRNSTYKRACGHGCGQPKCTVHNVHPCVRWMVTESKEQMGP